MSPCFNLVVDLQLRCVNWSTRASGSKSLYPLKISLRSRRSEVVGTRKNGTAEGETPRVSPSRAPVLSFVHYLQAPATQATNFVHPLFFISSGYYSRPKKNWKQYLLGHPIIPTTKERTSRAGLIVYAFECTSAIKGFKYRTPCRCLLVRTVSKRRLIKENCSSFSIWKSNCENLGFGDREFGGRDW